MLRPDAYYLSELPNAESAGEGAIAYVRDDGSIRKSNGSVWQTLTGSTGATGATGPSGSQSFAIFNVKDYGAVGDGVTDDIVAIHAAIQAGRDAVAAGSPGAEIYFPRGTYLVSRSINWLNTSNQLIKGSGMYQTTITCTTNLNGGDAGVPSDPSQNNLINASNASLGLPANYMHDLGVEDITLDCSNMSLDAIQFGWYVGQSSAAWECQDVHRPYARRVRVLNGNCNAIVYGTTNPAAAYGLEDGIIEDCILVNTPRGILFQYDGGSGGDGPTGLGLQTGAMIRGRVQRNTIIGANGPWYAWFNCTGTICSDNIVYGFNGSALAYQSFAGSLSQDFGNTDCTYENNRHIEAGPLVLLGNMSPNFYNSFLGTPGSIGCQVKGNQFTRTARAPFSGPPAVPAAPGGTVRNTSGRDCHVELNPGSGCVIDSVQVGKRADDNTINQPNTVRHFVVPNGQSMTIAYHGGTLTWTWWTARLAWSGAPAVPSSGGSVTNSSGIQQIVRLRPTATRSAVAVPYLSLPPSAGVVVQIDGIDQTRTGIRASTFSVPIGKSLTLTWDATQLLNVLRAYYPGSPNLVLSGSPPFAWTWSYVVQWTATPAVPATSGTVYNPLAVPVGVQVETNSFSGISCADASGSVTQTTQVISDENGKSHFMIDPGGSVTVTWSGSAPTWTWWILPNAWYPTLQMTAGSVGPATVGQATDNRIVDNVIRQAPFNFFVGYDVKRNTFDNHVINCSEWRPGISYQFLDSGVTGGGSKDNIVTGVMADTRTSPTTAYHFQDNGANNTGNQLRSAYLSATSGSSINLVGGAASRLKANGNRGAGATIGQVSAGTVPIPSTTVAFSNPTSFDCDVYVNGGTVTNVAIDGVATSLISGHFVVRNGGQITLTYSVAPIWVWFIKPA